MIFFLSVQNKKMFTECMQHQQQWSKTESVSQSGPILSRPFLKDYKAGCYLPPKQQTNNNYNSNNKINKKYLLTQTVKQNKPNWDNFAININGGIK